jgi:nucleotide-binding universal stress UspA family protein
LIVPVDGSDAADRALAIGAGFAARFDGCELVVMRAHLDDGERNRASVEALAARATTPARAVCVTGDATGSILRLAQHEPDAVVCMATHGRGRLAAPLLGSVAAEVLRGSDAPVLLVGPHCEPTSWPDQPQLVTCWIGAPSDPILPIAGAWGRELGMELTLLGVFHPLDVPASTAPDAQFAVAGQELGTATLPRVVAVRDDHPAGAIVAYARELPATLLALTTRARHGLGRVALGSVAMDVVHRSPCPVLVVRAPR